MPDLVRLKGLHIDRVAFVEQGDNPKAHVAMWKSRKAAPTKTDVHVDALEGKPKKKKPPWLAKRDALDGTFAVEKATAESLADQIDEIAGAWRAQAGPFDDSGWVREIYPDRVIVCKDGENYSVTYSVSDGEVKFDLSSAAEVQQTWVTAKGDQEAGDGKETTVAPTRKDLPDDLPEEVTKYLDAIEKEAADNAAKLDAIEKEKADAAKAKADAEGTTDAEALAKALKDADPAIAKALEQATADAKAATEKAEAATVKADAADAEVTKLRVEKADADAIEKAKALKYLTLKPEEVGPAMRKLAESDPDLAKTIEAVLVSANATSSEAFKEIGKDRGGAQSEIGGDAEDKLNALAKALATTKGITEAEALTEVVETPEGRELMAAFEDDRLEGVDR